MSDSGLSQVTNPSALFLADRDQAVSGTSVFAGMEGTRPVLVEIQALTAPTSFGTPRRAVVGWDSGRLNMVLAVLEARCGLSMGQNDVYLNVAGGLRISEPAADLAVAAALVSSLNGSVVPTDTVVFGEIGLSGEVRPVSREDVRLKEAGKLGFKRAVVPETRGTKKERAPNPSESAKERDAAAQTVRIRHLNELLDVLQAPRRAAQPNQTTTRPAVRAES
jgi:DNA repair protein RadA/Sms